MTFDYDVKCLRDMDTEDWKYCSKCGTFLMPSEIDEGELCMVCQKGEEENDV